MSSDQGAVPPGGIVLSETSAEIRGANEGSRLQVGDQSFLVSAIVPDEVAAGFEGIVKGPAPDGWGETYVLLRSDTPIEVERSARRILQGEPFRVRASGETPFLRYADAVTPQLYFKAQFGEFSARASGGGTFQVDRRWHRDHIVEAQLPLLGRVTCHERLIEQLRPALREIVDHGLSGHVRPDEFAGCFSPRHIGWSETERLSSHAWGAAVDINAASNPFGAEPTIDRRIVRVLKEHGFNWGGDWLVPDGMHFEWRGPTAGA